MLFSWGEQVYKWFEDAGEYTGYNKKMAELLRLELDGCETLCDIGCGMAQVDFELASDFKELSCVDISSEIIDYVQKSIQEKKKANMKTICADGMKLSGQWDAVMTLFHGDIEDCFEPYYKLAKKKLIIVSHGSAYTSTGPEKYRLKKCGTVEQTKDWLESKGFSYKLKEAALEFGQPHRSFEEALAYTKNISKDAPEKEVISFLKENLVQTGREDFPYYTPKTRKFGIFAIEK